MIFVWWWTNAQFSICRTSNRASAKASAKIHGKLGIFEEIMPGSLKAQKNAQEPSSSSSCWWKYCAKCLSWSYENVNRFQSFPAPTKRQYSKVKSLSMGIFLTLQQFFSLFIFNGRANSTSHHHSSLRFDSSSSRRQQKIDFLSSQIIFLRLKKIWKMSEIGNSCISISGLNTRKNDDAWS